MLGKVLWVWGLGFGVTGFGFQASVVGSRVQDVVLCGFQDVCSCTYPDGG